MKDLIALVRMMNLYYHHLHNISHGVSFSSDHEMMSEFYTQLEGSYDSLIERYIGLGDEADKACLLQIIKDAHSVLEDIPDSNDMETNFHYASNMESLLRSQLES